jgi:predicted nucleic acid-binding Zn ribbon protein
LPSRHATLIEEDTLPPAAAHIERCSEVLKALIEERIGQAAARERRYAAADAAASRLKEEHCREEGEAET